MKPDMSPEAITARLQRVEELRRLCLSLGEAGKKAGLHGGGAGKPAREGKSPDGPPEEKKDARRHPNA